MAIVNRELDSSEQKRTVNCAVSNTSTGITYPLYVVPAAGQLISAVQTVNGLSGAPAHSIWLHRFIAGTGFTSIVLGSTIASTAYGTSGAQTFSVSAAGASNLLLAGDQITLYTQGANTAALSVVVGLCIQSLQDIRTSYGG